MTTISSKANRIPALDFTKGALVLIMVFYHWLNYFYGPHDSRYLRFLTPSFIFVTGFLISNVYLSKYGLFNEQLPKRLVQRGLKILGVFAILNVTRNLLALGRSQGETSAHWSTRNLIDVYIMGSGVGGGQAKAIAFFILVPIGYLLMLSAVLLVVSRFYRYAFHVACLLFLLCLIGINSQGLESPNLELLIIGLLGVLVGHIRWEKLNALVRHPYLLAAGYLLYLGAITLWNVVYPLQVIGVCLSLMIIYLVGQRSGEPGKVTGRIVLLGKYSLFGYITQIAILQFLRLGLNRIDSEIAVLGLSFGLAFALTILSVEIVDFTRAGSIAVDRLYKAVFA
jgi:hypothetical protein